MNKQRMWQAVIILLVVSFGLAAAAQQSFGVGKVRAIYIAETVRVGDALLPAGDYNVKHEMAGSEHVLVFTSQANPKIATRVNCKMVQLAKKAERTEQEYIRKGEERVLTALTFKGDNFRHEL